MDAKELGQRSIYPEQTPLVLGEMQSKGGEQVWPILKPGKTIPGITLRQHYAGLAMQGMLTRDGGQHAAKSAVAVADALLAELAKEA